MRNILSIFSFLLRARKTRPNNVQLQKMAPNYTSNHSMLLLKIKHTGSMLLRSRRRSKKGAAIINPTRATPEALSCTHTSTRKDQNGNDPPQRRVPPVHFSGSCTILLGSLNNRPQPLCVSRLRKQVLLLCCTRPRKSTCAR